MCLRPVHTFFASVVSPVAVSAVVLACLAPALACSQEDPKAVVAAMERLATEAIERAEKSVVAIARVPKDGLPSEAAPPEGAALATRLLDQPDPTDPRFVPTEFGTGVVIDAKGLIVTNQHVVGNVRRADYYVWIGRKPFRATVKAADPWLDLAVLQVEGGTWTPMTMGDAQKLKKGQFVIALGNPHAIARDGRPSAAWGLVSNLERQAPPPRAATRGGDGRETLHHYGTLIQTDARLELGASGGALVNLQGEMIGLTTSLAALAGYERPGGFAIPVDDSFRRALESLRTGRLPDYGLLGVEPAALSLVQRQRGLVGARIRSIADATPARQAGLREGDIITHIDERLIEDDLALVRQISGLPAGATVSVRLLRGSDERRTGRPITVSARLAKKRIGSLREGYAQAPPETWRGLRVEYATAAPLFSERSRDLGPQGCVGIVEVARDSAAWKAELRPGDFICRVDQTPVATPAEFYAAVRAAEGPVTLHLTGVDLRRAVCTVPAE